MYLLNEFCLFLCGGVRDRDGRQVVKHFMDLQSKSVQNSMRVCSAAVTKYTYYWPLNHPLKIHWKFTENPKKQWWQKTVDFQWIFSGFSVGGFPLVHRHKTDRWPVRERGETVAGKIRSWPRVSIFCSSWGSRWSGTGLAIPIIHIYVCVYEYI